MSSDTCIEATTDSDNGLSPVLCQAITKINAELLSTEPVGTNLNEILINLNSFCQENIFENVISKMAAILSRPQCV